MTKTLKIKGVTYIKINEVYYIVTEKEKGFKVLKVLTCKKLDIKF